MPLFKEGIPTWSGPQQGEICLISLGAGLLALLLLNRLRKRLKRNAFTGLKRLLELLSASPLSLADHNGLQHAYDTYTHTQAYSAPACRVCDCLKLIQSSRVLSSNFGNAGLDARHGIVWNFLWPKLTYSRSRWASPAPSSRR